MIIAGSFKRDKLIELCQYTAISHSISYYDVENHGMFTVMRGQGPLEYDKLDNDRGLYGIVMIQDAPEVSTQPASQYAPGIDDNYGEFHELWFKGKLDQREVEKLQFEEDTTAEWEAKLLLKHVVRNGCPVDVEGSFSCIYSDGKDLYIFRNELEKMYFDIDMNICTERADDDTKFFPTSPNKMFKIDFKRNKLIQVDEFQTVRRWYPEDK